MKDEKVYIEDILESIEKIEEYTDPITEDEFYSDTMIQDAVFRRLTIIEEAVKNIPPKTRDIPWKRITGIRDILTHQIFGS